MIEHKVKRYSPFTKKFSVLLDKKSLDDIKKLNLEHEIFIVPDKLKKDHFLENLTDLEVFYQGGLKKKILA